MNNYTKTLIFLFIIIISSPIHAVEVNKKDWVNAMTTALPAAFCNSSQYFRQCFSVTPQECEETAASVTRICLNNNNDKIPPKLQQSKDGAHWGTIIGACAGEAYEVALIKKRIKNTKCNNPSNWQ